MNKAMKSPLFSACYDIYIYILLTIFYITLLMSIFGDFYCIPIVILCGLIYLNHLRILRKSYNENLYYISKIIKRKTFMSSRKLSNYMYIYYILTRFVLPICNFFVCLVIGNKAIVVAFTVFVFLLSLHYNFSRELGMNYRASKRLN